MAFTLPPCQRAWTYTTWGMPRQILTLADQFEVPSPPAKADLIIRVSHVSLNPGCYITMNAIPPFVRRLISGKTVYVPEGEFSGVVHLAGPAAPSHLQPGTRVFGSLPVSTLFSGQGTLAEYIRLPANVVAVVPSSLNWAEASGLSGGGLTAVCMLQEANITPGTRIFINGASGGVGTMLLQLAKAQGAYIVATCSPRTKALVKSLGADEVVDYRTHCPLPSFLAQNYAPFTYIFDTIGTQALFEGSPSYLLPSGLYINVGNFEGFGTAIWNAMRNSYLPKLFGGVPRRYLMVSTTPNAEKATVLARVAEEGTVKVVVDEVFAFEDALKAYDRITERHAMGKVIIKVQDI
ncbi:Zn(2)-C6 fungal-type domain-containing protein [Mycena indigotica]|uniref:Zn(2)-C6 fungal-type domain-containing protein n=1 Tax=Mycena indigotica TaxID=2126181 RepID=A0A8H6SFD9_9AGAR|nr:Zn(2)-C6 fungal-type domain-containing protein [Mycena indigotica]KAF7297357.1 Zn(2)-C6 fungal-type domain-containing protein [Mycena indigotica]